MATHLFACQLCVVASCGAGHPAFALVFGLLQQVVEKSFKVRVVGAFLVLLVHAHVHLLFMSLAQLV